jgi:hypothetical protein
MRTMSVSVYKFDELSDSAKEKAIERFRDGMSCDFWIEDGLDSIKKFCAEFNVSLTHYSVGAYCHIEFKTDATNKNFRGLKLKDFDKEAMPTGYCVDSDLRYKFHDEFTQTGDALYAFNEAVEAGFRSIRADMEYQLTDEAITESIECNEYEFTEDGKLI